MREEYIMIKQTWSSNWRQIDGISVEPVDQALHVGAEKVSVWLPMLPFIGSNIPSFFLPDSILILLDQGRTIGLIRTC